MPGFKLLCFKDVKSQTVIDMRRLIAIATVMLALCANTVMAQENRGHNRDPKQMTERMSQKLNFSEEQKSKLIALNEKYTGDAYDKEKYRNEFKDILTDEQKKQMEEIRRQRMERMKENASAE